MKHSKIIQTNLSKADVLKQPDVTIMHEPAVFTRDVEDFLLWVYPKFGNEIVASGYIEFCGGDKYDYCSKDGVVFDCIERTSIEKYVSKGV